MTQFHDNRFVIDLVLFGKRRAVPDSNHGAPVL